MVKRPGQCAFGSCISAGELRKLRYWPGGMRETRGTLPSVCLCETHLPSVVAKMIDARHWRAVYSVGVLSFRPTGVSLES